MRLFKWDTGRQNTSYRKLPLLLFPRLDLYLIHYREGAHIGPHVDPVTRGRHYRVNVVLTKAQQGGEFRCADPIFETGRIKFFRPDVSRHEVTRLERGTRWVLSLGWVL